MGWIASPSFVFYCIELMSYPRGGCPMENLLPWLRLQFTPGLGRAGLMRLIDHFKTPEQALDAASKGWPKLPGLRQGLASMVPEVNTSIIQKAGQTLHDMNGWLCTFWDPAYPQALRHISDPPALLYGCGSWPKGPSLAIVGARYPTNFGRVFTEKLAEEVGSAGVVVISGLARGIDAAAHCGALRRQTALPPDHRTGHDHF
jgi:DNA processing protein